MSLAELNMRFNMTAMKDNRLTTFIFAYCAIYKIAGSIQYAVSSELSAGLCCDWLVMSWDTCNQSKSTRRAITLVWIVLLWMEQMLVLRGDFISDKLYLSWITKVIQLCKVIQTHLSLHYLSACFHTPCISMYIFVCVFPV